MNCIRTIQTKVLDDEELKSYINRAADILHTHTQLRGEALVYRLLRDLKIFRLFTITKFLDPKYWHENDDDNDDNDDDNNNKEQEQGGRKKKNDDISIGLLIAFDIYRIINKLQKIKLNIAKSIDRVCSSSSGSSSSDSSSSSVEEEEEEEKKQALRHVQNIAKSCEEILDILDDVDNRVKLDTLELILIKILSIAVSYRHIAKLTSLSSKWVSYLLDAMDRYYNNYCYNNNNAASKGIIDNIDNNDENNKHLPKATAYARVIRLLEEGFFIEFERDIKAGEKVNIIPYILREAKRKERAHVDGWMDGDRHEQTKTVSDR
ncbi:MAG: hypothetical protein QXI43_00280 [Candidatus Nitrosocaldus sp.]